MEQVTESTERAADPKAQKAADPMDGVGQHRGSGTRCKALHAGPIRGAASNKSPVDDV